MSYLTVEGERDERVRVFVQPKRVVWQQPESAPGVEGAENLLKAGGAPCRMKLTGTGAGILLDFGREIHGGVLLENGMTPAHAPVKVRVCFGESVSEAMGDPNNDHAIHHQVVEIPWYGYTEIGNTGFRFVRIDLVEPNSELELKRAQAVFIYRDAEYAGAFHSSDDRLNQIWQTGAYTSHLCMQDRLWDGIKRDRLVWIGDMHPETSVISAVFGAHPVVPKSLDYVRDQTALPGWMNGISSYSMWWVLIHRAWYLHHGDMAYLETQRPYLLGLLAQLRDQIDNDGKEKMAPHRFLDWPSSEDQAAIHAGLHALLTMTLKAGAALCLALGECQVQRECEMAVDRLRRYTPPPSPSKQANALLALSGIADPVATNRDVLAANPLKGISTFYGFYVLQARALAGDFAGALEVIRRYWGAMLDLGATTFWEDFDLAWAENAGRIDEIVPAGKHDVHAEYGNYCYKGLRHSFCHGWASGPTAWLSEHVLGFRPLEPGCAKLAVDPHLVDLEFAEGAFPTPRGAVKVRHTKSSSGKVETKLEAPDGITIRQAGT